MPNLESLYDIEFNEKLGKDFGMVFLSSPKIVSASRNYKTSVVNGRLGNSISLFKGKDNATIECEFWVITDNIHESIREIRQWLYGSGKLRFSDNADAYYEVLVVDSVQVEKRTLKHGKCNVKFIVYPYEFINEGQFETEEINYNRYSECMPVYRINGEGICIQTVNGNEYEANVPGTIIIDSRKMQAFKEDYSNANTLVKGDYEDLILPHGEVSISISNGFKLSIKPNWGYLL